MGAVRSLPSCRRARLRLHGHSTASLRPPSYTRSNLAGPGDVEVVLQIWDIGGQSIGSKMLPNYIHGSHAVLFCYDITNYDSFANLEDWYRKVHGTYNKASGGGAPMPCMALLGNKVDLSHMRAVRHDHHNRFADENRMHSYMLSAKNGDQVSRQKLRAPFQPSAVNQNTGDSWRHTPP